MNLYYHILSLNGNILSFYLTLFINLLRYIYDNTGGVKLKKLKRSRNKIILGVCAGMAEYFNIDPTIIRIIWLVLAFASFGTFGIAYLVCGVVMPEDDGIIHQDDENYGTNENTNLFIGIGLVLMGLFLLARIIFPRFSFTIRQALRYWPVLLILLGLYILFNHKNEKN